MTSFEALSSTGPEFSFDMTKLLERPGKVNKTVTAMAASPPGAG